ncbi:dienelactone hydrolase family protein [Fulvivirga ulvae]|uniref:alpha/beta hydrolase family protein n=1 Tax=Fulvivirga ulvae TaxID=2904245 RepID=UPI001F3947F6|nr:alpha/beta family hydrolase [Fulvivirga ulvae]UII31310.1 dienelactone hydrolase family protein [Fulvivirga ulvae]
MTEKINVSEKIGLVSCEILPAPSAKAVMVLSHGAGAGMHHQFMISLAEQLAEVNITSLRFNFPYMEQGKKRPDVPRIAVKTIEEAINKARQLFPELPIFGGGKSFGGRMTSLYAASNHHDLAGLVFYGFPLHPPGKPSVNRADHLSKINCPMLFLQGTRDKLATSSLITEVTASLSKATLINLEGADHSFHMLKKSGITDEQVIRQLAVHTLKWTLR